MKPKTILKHMVSVLYVTNLRCSHIAKGKKFKGPDFVRKHIMTKHVEKVEEVKKEVGFFNSYLKVSR